jgi:hypothetical protein
MRRHGNQSTSSVRRRVDHSGLSFRIGHTAQTTGARIVRKSGTAQAGQKVDSSKRRWNRLSATIGRLAGRACISRNFVKRCRRRAVRWMCDRHDAGGSKACGSSWATIVPACCLRTCSSYFKFINLLRQHTAIAGTAYETTKKQSLKIPDLDHGYLVHDLMKLGDCA